MNYRYCLFIWSLALGLVSAQGSGLYGQLQPGQLQQQTIAAASAGSVVYHTYQIQVPAGTQQLRFHLTDNGQDLDLAAKAGSEIVDYETDVDAIDVSETANPILSIDNPRAGIWYLDVINFYETSASYQLRVEISSNTQAPPPAAPIQSQPPPPAQNQTPPTSSGIGLAGSWQYYDSAFYSINTLDFLADGRYRYTERAEFSDDFSLIEEGRYVFDGQALHFEPWCGTPASIQTRQQGQDLVLSFDNGSTRHYSYLPNSNVTTTAELEALYARIEQESQAFEARTPLALVRPGPSPQEPGITDRIDSNSQAIFPNATVFAQNELYNYYSSYYWYRMLDGSMSQTSVSQCIIDPNGCELLRDHSHSTYRDQLSYIFFPNGRFFYKATQYGIGSDPSTNPVTPAVEAAWGRYRIDGIEIRLESAAENRTATFLNGRQYLSGAICIPEIESELERSQQQ